MAVDFVKMRTDLYRDPRVIRMAREIAKASRTRPTLSSDSHGTVHGRVLDNGGHECDMSILRHAVVGGLLLAWGTARHTAKRIGDDAILPGADDQILDTLAELPGLAAGMRAVGWLTDSPQGVAMPRFYVEHNQDPEEARRERDAARKRQQRARTKGADISESVRGQSADSHGTVTGPSAESPRKRRVEKRREEESISLSQGERELPVGEKPKAEERLLTGPSWLPDVIRPRGWEDRPEVTAALERWVKYCSTSPHGPSNQIKLEDNLKTLADAGCTPERFSKAVTASIASGWKRIYEDFQKAPTAITGKRGKKPEEADRYSRADRETLLAAMLEWGLAPKDNRGPEPTFQSLGLQPMEGC